MSWTYERLSSLGKVVTGATPSTSVSDHYGGKVPFVTPVDLDRSEPIQSASRTLSELGAGKSRLLPPDTVMVCCIGSIGKVGIAGRELCTNQQINSIIFDPRKVFPQYGYYACRQLRPILRSISPSTTLPIVSKSKFMDLAIPVPPIAEQHRIAEMLGRTDRLLAKRRKAIALLDDLAQSIFLDMFGNPESNPSGWPRSRFGSLLAEPLRNGVSPSKGGPVEAKVLTLSAITGSRFDSSALKLGTFNSMPPIRQSVNRADFLICRGNGNKELVGKGHYSTESYSDVTFPDTIIAARVRADLIDRPFLEHVWNMPTIRRQIESSARTTNGTFKVNQTALENICLIQPPLESQKEFGRQIAGIKALHRSHQEHLGVLEALFSSMQHRAFRGEL